MGFYRGAAKAVFGSARVANRAGRAAVPAVATGLQRSRLRHAARVAASGVLTPGDPDPPPTGPTDFYDYRGVMTPPELRPLEGQPFSLGRVIDPRRGTGFAIGLPFGVLERHAAVIGPTGSGKTKSVLIPWIATALMLGHSVFAVDIAGDLLDDLRTHRNAIGPFGATVGKWDYSDPGASLNWNWVAALDDEEAVVAAVEAIHGRQPANDAQPFFHQRDGRILRGLIELARFIEPDANPADLLALLRDGQTLEMIVRANPRHPGAQRLVDVVGRSPGEYLQVVSGVINDLEMWDHPGLRAVTSHRQLDLGSWLDQPSLLVIGAPIHGSTTSETASGLMLSQIINRLYRRFTHDNGRHVFLVIDEAARLTNRLRFEELLSVARRARVTVVLATQDAGQFADENERLAILGNCATYISLPGRSAQNVAYLRGRLGKRFQSNISLTHNPGMNRRQLSQASQIAEVDVLGHREILDPPWGERSAIVHSQPVSNKPFLVDLTRPEFL